MAEGIGRSTCIALIPHLDELKRAGYRKIGLRATIDVENVREKEMVKWMKRALDYGYEDDGFRD
jgi:hypothetical protein